MLELFHSIQKSTAKRISSLVGTIVKMGIANGPVARMWTRSLYALVNKAPSWDSPITLSDNASTEIEFWSLCFEKFNGNHIWPTSPIVNVMSYSDSSDFAWGGYIVQYADHVAKGSFTEVEAVDIFKLCIEFKIQLFPEWIPRGDNQWADIVSKDLDRDDT